MADNEHDWASLLSEFEESSAGQMIIEDGYEFGLHVSEEGFPFAKVNASEDYLASLQDSSTLLLMSNKPRLEIM